jgi:chitinase
VHKRRLGFSWCRARLSVPNDYTQASRRMIFHRSHFPSQSTTSLAADMVALSLLLLFSCTLSCAFELRWPQASWLLSRDAATDSTTITEGQEAAFSVARHVCPASCDVVGFDSSAWTAYHNINRLALCNSTMLLDFTIHNPLSDIDTRSLLRSCTAAKDVPVTSGSEATFGHENARIAKRDDSSCIPHGNTISSQASLQIASNGTASTTPANGVQQASQAIAQYLDQQQSGCGQASSFAYSGSIVMGIFAGSAVFDQGIAESILQQFTSKIAGSNIPENTAVQLCSHNMSSRYTLGIAINTKADVAAVQILVATWDAGRCVDKYDTASNWKEITLSVPAPLDNSSIPQNWTSANDTTLLAARNLLPRADCKTIQVASGESCGSLAKECGITGDQFTKCNPKQNLCSTLAPGQHVCCSIGTLPDFSPKPNSNGTCYTYLVRSGDSCSALAGRYSLTIDQIESFNQQTWGWMGCNDLQARETMCLSKGSPPIPAVIPNANCGPQVPKTPVTGSGTDLSTLNPCPLRACCDIWGQCGVTSEFCTQSKSPTGAPGTAAKGQNGCSSNCGTDIIKGSPPSSFFKVGYFEGFNTARPCLNQAIDTVSLSGYTHIHMAFAGISTRFALDVSAIQQQFDAFTTMRGFKKILSVGGWAFCTDPSTYNIFRQAVTSANRDTFASNIVSFMNAYQLDGIDLDWEYPAENDIPGIPSSTKADVGNFVAFMSSLRNKMPDGKTISFTAPASYWYLRAFEMSKLSLLVDYVVYMT